MTLSENFGTLSQTLDGLKLQGYTIDFNVREECLVCPQHDIMLSPDEFHIDKVYRFEGETDPDDQSIVFAISSPKFKAKGVLVNGYGIFADETASKLIEKLQTHAPFIIVKRIEATPQRTDGDRLIDAPLLEMDLNKLIEKMKIESNWNKNGHNSITILKSANMRIVLLGLRANSEMKEHKAGGVISVQVLEGKINFITAEQNAVIEKGQMISLQENILHKVQAQTDSFFLLTLAMHA